MNELPTNRTELCALPLGAFVHRVNDRPAWLYGDGMYEHGIPHCSISIPVSLASRILSRVLEKGSDENYYYILSTGRRYIVTILVRSGCSRMTTFYLED